MPDAAGSLIDELRRVAGSSAVLTGPDDLDPFLKDWRGMYRGAAACVVQPASTAEVAAIVRACARARVPVVPQGGNTSLSGGSVPDEGGAAVIVSLARMRRIRSIDVADNSMEVEAGCVLQAVQEAAASAGRLYPVSLGAEGSCQIGGTIATNAGGTSVLRYGSTRDNVLGLEVVLPNGEVWDGLYRLRKNNTGPDLKHLFIGSEGTLGIVTAATLKLHPRPTAQCVAWIACPSPAHALQLLGRFQSACGPWLTAFEMIDTGQLGKVLQHLPDRRSPVAASHPWHMLVELAHAGAEQALGDTMEQLLVEATDAGLVADAAIAKSGAQREAMWLVRHSVSEANRKGGMSVSMDTAVPVSCVPEFIERATAAVRRMVPDIEVLTVTHLGDGNVHFIPFFSFPAWEALANAEAVALGIRDRVNEVAHELGGTFSAEHGVGRTHCEEMSRFKPAVELALMRKIKNVLDPSGLFNPGRLLPAATSDPP